MSVKKHIPNAITSLNLAFGLVGVVFALEGRLELAFALMLFAALADFCDGLAARLLDSYSEVGKQLDSLSDLVSFGLLPALMMNRTLVYCTWSHSLWALLPLVFAVFAAFRLAIFNVDELQHSNFRGLPVPVAGLMCASLCCYVAYRPASLCGILCSTYSFLPLLSLVLGVLMVSRIPMFSLKFGKGIESEPGLKSKRISFIVEAALILILVSVFAHSFALALCLICLLYVIKNLAYAVFKV